jgi:hypothetical protein
MEEKIRDFIIQELWDLVDIVVDYKDYGGPIPETDYIEAKKEKLIDLVGKDYYEKEDNPRINQARFIIKNAERCVNTVKDSK